MITKYYRLYGSVDALPEIICRVTCEINFTTLKRKKILWVIRDADDITLNDYTVAKVTAESEEECRSFLDEQILGGLFFGDYVIEHIEEL